MIKKIVWASVFILAAGIIQSTLLSRIALFNAVPDLTLGILVYIAYVNGTMTGQITGFFSGFLLDFLSAAPLGYNAFVRTLIGALTGLMKGTFFLDIFFLPMSLCAGATLIKAVCRNLLGLLFAGALPSYNFFLPTFWVELGLNIVTAPLLFFILKLFKKTLTGERKA
ncbi:MAG: rod shape-determining protein MreD [Treponema sp.]|nr:rod shape-determining protein MreD [Treponema sp.]